MFPNNKNNIKVDKSKAKLLENLFKKISNNDQMKVVDT